MAVQEMVSQILQHHQAFQARHYLKGKRIGVVGTPSSWLVACHVDYLLASKRWGVTYVDIPIEEVYKLYNQITDDEVGVEASLFFFFSLRRGQCECAGQTEHEDFSHKLNLG